MLYSQRQPLKVRQNNVTFLNVKFDGVAGANTISGLDSKFVSSVTDLGAGNYKINLKDKAQRALVPVGHEVYTDGLYLRVTAMAVDSITVLIKTFAGVATDGAFDIWFAYHEDRTLY